MGKRVEVLPTKGYVYDGSEEAGKRAFARAHAPYQCLLCGGMFVTKDHHRHYDKVELTIVKNDSRIKKQEGGHAP